MKKRITLFASTCLILFVFAYPVFRGFEEIVAWGFQGNGDLLALSFFYEHPAITSIFCASGYALATLLGGGTSVRDYLVCCIKFGVMCAVVYYFLSPWVDTIRMIER